MCMRLVRCCSIDASAASVVCVLMCMRLVSCCSISAASISAVSTVCVLVCMRLVSISASITMCVRLISIRISVSTVGVVFSVVAEVSPHVSLQVVAERVVLITMGTSIRPQPTVEKRKES